MPDSAWESPSDLQSQIRPHRLAMPLGSDIPESVVRAPPPSWSQFVANSRPQFAMPLGNELGESAAMPRQPLDLSGVRTIPAGAGKFGFGAFGVGDRWATLAASLNPHAQIEAKAKLEGSAQVSNRIDIGLAPGFALVRSDSNVRADGALRSDVGISMPRDE